MSMFAVPTAPEEIHGLARAFDGFTAATARLEREYATLRARLARLTAELEEKNRLLAESVERERRLEAEALRQSRLAAMGEMAAMLAHEIRNPLGAMELFTGLLLNLMRNAAQAMPTGGTLTVGVECGVDGTRVTVADTGPGIPVGAEADIFRPFFTTRAKGTGLGLAVVQELVGAMSGTLAVASEPGRGATFTVVLPAAEKEGSGA